ncbi:MAG TPA: RagB/SusD family nutrient uptake outer membrane protein [Bacteroidales bacterium]|nr:RagB/SusD family nutrient uptake outer membrane protein [Bacteroidales bacterium]
MRTKILLIITGFLFFASCSEDFITKDFDKTRYVPESFYNTKEHAIQALNATYSTLNQWANGYGWSLGIMHFVLGDDLYETGYASGFTPWGAITNFDILANQSAVEDLWNSYYQNILVANNALSVMPKAKEQANDPDFSDEELRLMMGQAYFIRAFNYWNLAQYFGDENIVIRRDPPAAEADFLRDPAPVDSVRAFIISDLKKAQEYLVNGLNTTAGYEKGRATRGAATALLGKFYMNRKMYAEAAAEFKKLLPGVGDPAYGTYTLMPSYRDNFTRFTENNSESIFEIQFENMNSQPAWANNDVNWVFQNFTLNRTSWDIMWWNFAAPKYKLEGFENWTENINGAPTTVYDYRAYETFWGIPNGANFTDQNGVTRNWIEQDWQNESVVGQLGVLGIRKYALDKASDAPAGLDPLWSDNNIRIMRLGGIMLLYAESLANLNPGNMAAGDPNSAVYWIDQIRTRANNPMNDQPNLYSARPTVRGQLPTASALMTARGWTLMDLIEHERYVEGFCEGWRKEDLKRWEKGITAVRDKPGWRGYESLTLPVPQTEVDRNPGF